MHPRTVIRHALIAYLGQPAPDTAPPSYRTSAGDRVFARHFAALPPSVLPVLTVSTDQDKRDMTVPITDDGPVRRQLAILLDGVVAGGDADDKADALSLEVEDALRANPTLGGLLESLRWEGTVTDGAIIGETAVATVRMTVSAVYYSHLPSEGGPPLPTRLYGSWEPNTGPAHLADYREMTDGRPPEIA